MRREKREQVRKRAERQVRELFRQAEEAETRERANRYVELALKTASKTKTPIPRELKRRFCRNCHTYFVPGENCRIRVSKGKIVYYCLNCKHFRRFVYK